MRKIYLIENEEGTTKHTDNIQIDETGKMFLPILFLPKQDSQQTGVNAKEQKRE